MSQQYAAFCAQSWFSLQLWFPCNFNDITSNTTWNRLIAYQIMLPSEF